MRTSICLLGVLLLAALAAAATPVLADDIGTGPDSAIARDRPANAILDFDRRYDVTQRSPSPDPPGKPKPKPPKPHSVSSSGAYAAGGGWLGSAIVGGGVESLTRSERIERSLRTTAERLR